MQSSSTSFPLCTTHADFLTFHSDLGRSLDHAQRGYGHAGVVGRLADVGELQDVAANGHLLLSRELHLAARPLDVRHGGADCHACQVDAAAGHHLMIGGGDGETGRHTTNCRGKERERERAQWRREGRGGPLDHWADAVFAGSGLYYATVRVRGSGWWSLVEIYRPIRLAHLFQTV